MRSSDTGRARRVTDIHAAEQIAAEGDAGAPQMSSHSAVESSLQLSRRGVRRLIQEACPSLAKLDRIDTQRFMEALQDLV